MELPLFEIRARCICSDLVPSLPTELAASLGDFIQRWVFNLSFYVK